MRRQKAVDTAQKAKRGALQVVFGRTAVVVVLVLIQFAMMVGLVTYLRNFVIPIYAVLFLISTGVVIYIINQKGNPAFKITWILCILVFHVFGTIFYLFAKFQLGTKVMEAKLDSLRVETREYLSQDRQIVDALRINKPANANLSYYLYNQLGFPTYRNTAVEYFPLGDDKFPVLLRELKKAEHFIFMEYFIVEKSYMWDKIREILEYKAAEGVEIRFMYDGMCSISMLPYHYPEKLKEKGIKCKMFNPVKPVLSTQQNNRDHRKICVIDGKVGFTGGINLGDEYINRKERFGHWKDTAVMLKGDAVRSFTLMFLQMWGIDERKDETAHFLSYPSFPADHAGGYVIPYGDCPLDNDKVGERVYMDILNRSLKYVHIMSPYLILDGETETALKFAAERGVEVVLILPGIPDKSIPYALAKTHYASLLASGVQIFEYTPGFVHAKVFVSDSREAVVGTINLDYRSLYHHFECATYLYGVDCVTQIEADFQATLAKCRQVSIETVRKEKWHVKLTGYFMKAVAPLM